MGQLWYLANDVQFFLILPWIIMAYLNKPIIGYIVTSILLIGNIICTWIISHVGKHSMSVINDSEEITNIYHMPYTRVGAYLVGIIFGMMYFEYMQSFKNPVYKVKFGTLFYSKVHSSWIVRWSFYIIGSIIMVFLISIPYTETYDFPNRKWGQVACDFFNCIHRPLFCLGLAMFFAGPMTGKTYLFRFIFGASGWAPWAKLTFMAYLVHTNVYGYFYFTTNQGFYMTKRYIWYEWFASFLVTYLV